MLVVVTVTILIIISVGIFMMYRPRPTTESDAVVGIGTESESEKPGPTPKKVVQIQGCKGAKGYWGPWSEFSPATVENDCVRNRTRKMIITDLGDMPCVRREFEERRCGMTRRNPPSCRQCD